MASKATPVTAGIIPPSSKLILDVVRIKKLPQSEDEPLPCSCSVRLTSIEYDSLTVHTDVQRNTNNPYYNQTTEVDLPTTFTADIPTLAFLAEVVEHARQPKPTVIRYGRVVINVNQASGAKPIELTVLLTVANPQTNPQNAMNEEERLQSQNAADTPTLVLRCRVVAPRVIKPIVDPNADVLLESIPLLSGAHMLVPRNSLHVWFNLVFDSAWCECFASSLVAVWKAAPPLVSARGKSAGPDGAKAKAKAPSSPRGGGSASARGSSAGSPKKGAAAAPVEIKTVRDVIYECWGCKRAHQVLARLRLSAEKFQEGCDNLLFNLEEETKRKLYWRERSLLRLQHSRRCFEAAGSTDKIRLVFDRLWWLMVAGIPAEGPAPVLGFDVRHRISQAAFTQQHAEVLQACLLQRIAPWLTFEECETFAKDDSDPRVLPSPVREVVFPAASASSDPKLAQQVCFVEVLTLFLGRLIDSLSDTEFSMALEGFAPAVREAHVRCQSLTPASASANVKSSSAAAAAPGSSPGSARKGKKGERSGSATKKSKKTAAAAPKEAEPAAALAIPGDGVNMKHLDKFGRRVEDAKFA